MRQGGVFDALSAPGSARLFAASMVGRIPPATLGLVFVLRTEELTGSFVAAGLASGAFALAAALVQPALGRLLDRRGQPGVLICAALACAGALIVYGLLEPGAAPGVIVACAAVTGAAMPPLGPCLRTLWPTLLGDPDRVHAALALEAAVLELTYIVGPVLIVGAIGAWSTGASTVACAVLLVAGTLGFALAPAVRVWRPPARVPGQRGALHATGVRTLIGLFALMGTAFGAVEVAAPAAADAAGSARASGLLLGLWGLGSLLGGLAAARARPPADRVRRLCGLLAGLGAGHLLLVLPMGLVGLAPLMVVAGAAIAPSFALAYGLVERVAPAGTITEAYTWLTTGVAFGFAAGSPLAGLLVQGAGPEAAFALSAAAALAAAAFTVVRRPTLAPGIA